MEPIIGFNVIVFVPITTICILLVWRKEGTAEFRKWLPFVGCCVAGVTLGLGGMAYSLLSNGTFFPWLVGLSSAALLIVSLCLLVWRVAND